MALDKLDHPTSVDGPAIAAITTTYRADGQVLTQAAPNGNTTTFDYDALGRELSRTTAAAGPVTRASLVRTYNRAGQVLSEDSQISGDPTNGIATYAYDPLERLTAVTRASTTTAYAWDDVPNRTSVQVGAGSLVTTSFDAANRPTTDSAGGTYSSDGDGRLNVAPGYRYEWDSLGRLTKVKPPTGNNAIASYSYDPLDRLRLADYGGSARVRFRYVGLTTGVAQTIDDQSGAVLRNIGNGWGGERLLDWTGTNSNIRYSGTNAHHDTVWTADSAGAVSATLRYDPWGTLTSSTGSSLPDFRFQGSWFDTTTSLSWVVTRWYAPSLGRFISEDSLLGDPADPPSRHLYAYAVGDPTSNWDPNGTFALGTCGGWGCSASWNASVRYLQLQAFFLRFPGVGMTTCEYRCFNISPLDGTGLGTPLLAFMKWEITTSRLTRSSWWRRVNQEIVNGALGAWRHFDLTFRYRRVASSDSTYRWFKYIKGAFVSPRGRERYPPGYHGGTREQMWAAHDHALWNGVIRAAPYYAEERLPERLVIFKVVSNVMWYSSSFPALDFGLASAIKLASYPSYSPARHIPSRAAACNMWYARNFTFEFFPIRVTCDPYEWQGPKPLIDRQLCDG